MAPMTENSSAARSARMVCDECGAHNTDDLAAGQICPLCNQGRLHLLEPWTPPRRPQHEPEHEPRGKCAEGD